MGLDLPPLLYHLQCQSCGFCSHFGRGELQWSQVAQGATGPVSRVVFPPGSKLLVAS